MKSTKYGIGLLIALLGLAGWWAYRTIQPTASSLNRLIPPDALIVLESQVEPGGESGSTANQLYLRQLPLFAEAQQKLDRFLLANSQADTTILSQASTFLGQKPVAWSLHSVSKETLDYLFYIPIQSATDAAFLESLQNPNPRQFRVQSHAFAGQQILELRNRQNELYGSFILTDSYLIGSQSSILTERAAQQLSHPVEHTIPTFTLDDTRLAGLFVQPTVLQSLFGQSATNNSLIHLFLPERLTLLFRPANGHNHLIGYAADEMGSRRDVAALFAGQTPLRLSSAALIPQTTATLYYLGLSDAPRFGQHMADLLATSANERLQARIARIRPEMASFYKQLAADVALCHLESPAGEERQVLLLKAANVAALSEAYQRVAYRAGAATSTAPRSFLGHKLLLLDAPELPASLFSNLFAGFGQSWITQHNDYLIVATSEAVMQDYLRQLDQQLVWQTDARQADLVGNTLRPASFTAFVRLNRAQMALPSTWPIAWRSLLGGPNPTLANLENLVYQASYGNEKISSTLVIGRTTRRAGATILNRLLLKRKVEFNEPITAAPLVAGNLRDGSAQIWTRDAIGQLVLTTTDGGKQIQSSTVGPIRSNPLAVDFLDNGHLQYLFTTDQTLYVADPLDQSVQVTPIRLPAGADPTYMTPPTGSRHKEWVALVSDKQGAVYALDKNSRAFVRVCVAPRAAPLLQPFQVMAEPEGMAIVGMQADGTLNYWQESSGRQKLHFPARLDLPFVSPALQPGGQTTIWGISQAGELLALNQQGLITARTQLYRPVRNGSFRLVPDVAQTDWLLLRTTDTEVAILDKNGRQLFEVRGINPGEHTIRYHRLGAGIDIISVKSGNFTILFDLNGQRIGDRPIPSDFPVTLQYDDATNERSVVTAASKRLSLFTIRLR